MTSLRVIVAVESYLVRKGLVSLLGRLDGIRHLHEFGEASALKAHLDEEGPCDLVLISHTLFDLSEAVFQQHSRLLDKTLLVQLDGSDVSKVNPGAILGIQDSKQDIQNKILSVLGIHPAGSGQDHVEVLTFREKTIVRLVSMGLTNKQIADQLFLSTHTVTTHRKNITGKLGIKSVSGLTVYAIVNNIITIEEVAANPSQ